MFGLLSLTVACNRKALGKIKCLKYGIHLKNILYGIRLLLDSFPPFARLFFRELYPCSSPALRAQWQCWTGLEGKEERHQGSISPSLHLGQAALHSGNSSMFSVASGAQQGLLEPLMSASISLQRLVSWCMFCWQSRIPGCNL